jgi:uncharacterized membrane protein
MCSGVIGQNCWRIYLIGSADNLVPIATARMISINHWVSLRCAAVQRPLVTTVGQPQQNREMAMTPTWTPSVSLVHAPAIRKIGIHDLRDALSHGVDDFLAIPTQLVFLCILYPIVGLFSARAAMGSDLLPLLYPVVAGISLLGPVLAVGIYELSRRREARLPVSWLNAFDVLTSPAIVGIGAIGVLLLVIFIAWLAIAKALFLATIGAAPPVTPGAFAQALVSNSA